MESFRRATSLWSSVWHVGNVHLKEVGISLCQAFASGKCVEEYIYIYIFFVLSNIKLDHNDIIVICDDLGITGKTTSNTWCSWVSWNWPVSPMFMLLSTSLHSPNAMRQITISHLPRISALPRSVQWSVRTACNAISGQIARHTTPCVVCVAICVVSGCSLYEYIQQNNTVMPDALACANPWFRM